MMPESDRQSTSTPSATHPSTASTIKAWLLAIAFLLAALFYLVLTFKDLPKLWFFSWFHILHSTPWQLAETFNDFTSNLFNAFFLWFLDGPSFLCVPSKLFAVLTLLLGNFVALFYMAFLLLINRSAVRAVLPCSSEEGDRPVFSPAASRTQSQIVGIIALVLFALAAVLLARSVGREGLIATRDVRGDAVARAVALDVAVSVVLPIVWLFMRESGRLWAAVGWVVVVLLFEYGGVCLYVVLLAWKSVKTDTALRYLLLSKGGRDMSQHVGDFV